AWIEDYWVDLGLFLLPIFLAVAGVMVSDEVTREISDDPAVRAGIQQATLWSIPLIVILHVTFFFLHIRKARRLSVLSDENEELKEQLFAATQDVRSLSEAFLYALARDPLEFGKNPENSERITLYAHDSNGSFI